MDKSQASALADLQMHWDEAYVITLDGNIWCARYRSSADQLRAHTSGELRELIRSDYAYRQKAGLVAYDPDEDDEVGGDGGADDAGEAVAGDDGTSPDDNGEPREDASAGHQHLDVGNFATMHGERMSL